MYITIIQLVRLILTHGGLPHKKSGTATILASCDVLILYGKYNASNASNARETHLDEDLLIWIFKPQLNDR